VPRIATLALVLLISSVWLPAQDSAQTTGKNSELTTIQGCLQLSMGRYTLTEEDGTTHELSGATGKLKHEVNREIEITGKPGIKTVDSTLVGGASSAVEKPVFEVKTVKRLADTCK
jgi:hypothetical protein